MLLRMWIPTQLTELRSGSVRGVLSLLLVVVAAVALVAAVLATWLARRTAR